jgi:hypothetical protein
LRAFEGKNSEFQKNVREVDMGKIMVLLLTVVIGACAMPTPPQQLQAGVQPKASALTPGMVKTKLIAGKTTQAEVLELFGPPDLVTSLEKGEMWGYDKVSRELAEAATGISLGATSLFGGAGGGVLGGILGGIGGGAQESRRVESTTTVFLLVYFDKQGIVTDYKLSATKF